MDESTVIHQQRIELAKESIAKLPAGMSEGQKALESLMIYRGCMAPVPDEVLKAITDCYLHFITGKPRVFWPEHEINNPSPMTLGEAFGVADIKGGRKTALKRKAMAIKQATLVGLFTGQSGKKKLSRARHGGISDAVKACDYRLTISEIEDWVQKHLAAQRKK